LFVKSAYNFGVFDPRETYFQDNKEVNYVLCEANQDVLGLLRA